MAKAVYRQKYGFVFHAILGLLIIAALLIAGQMSVAAQGDPPITSGLVDIGGYSLFIDCQGEHSEDTPTVVLESGMGDSGRAWLRVQRHIAEFGQVCVYDRAGLGGSEASLITPRTSQVIADELHTLLTNAGIEGPYVLIAHSFGGYNIRLFAHTYPDDMAGMILVQTGHEDQDFGLAEETDPDVIVFANRDGLTYAEWEESQALLRATRSEDDEPELGDMPLVVLTAGGAPSLEWPPELQEDLATLSANSVHIITGDNGHYIHNDQPELFLAAVQAVIESAQSGNTLDTEALQAYNIIEPTPMPTAVPQTVADPLYPPDTTLVIPGPGFVFQIVSDPGNLIPAGMCTVGAEAVVLQTVETGDGQHWLELECAGSVGWALESLFEEQE